MFVDCANFEYSRDIEMMRGGYGDNFFLMLRDNVRRFKGLADDESPNPPVAWKRYRCFADSASRPITSGTVARTSCCADAGAGACFSNGSLDGSTFR